MKTKIIFYTSSSGKNPVKQFIDSLPNKQQTKILRAFKYVKEYGLSVPLPQVRKITGSPLWEIRILGKYNLRVLYVIPVKNTLLALHGFIKKTNKTPRKEINTALKRYQDWLVMSSDE